MPVPICFQIYFTGRNIAAAVSAYFGFLFDIFRTVRTFPVFSGKFPLFLHFVIRFFLLADIKSYQQKKSKRKKKTKPKPSLPVPAFFQRNVSGRTGSNKRTKQINKKHKHLSAGINPKLFVTNKINIFRHTEIFFILRTFTKKSIKILYNSKNVFNLFFGGNDCADVRLRKVHKLADTDDLPPFGWFPPHCTAFTELCQIFRLRLCKNRE